MNEKVYAHCGVCKVGEHEIRIYISVQSTLTLNGRLEDREKKIDRCRMSCIWDEADVVMVDFMMSEAKVKKLYIYRIRNGM